MKIAEYEFSKYEQELCGPHKLIYIFSNLLVVVVMLLFYLTIQVDFVSRYSIYSLSRFLELSALFSWQAAIMVVASRGIGLLAIDILPLESESENSESSELISTLVRLYLLLEMLKLIRSISLDALTT